MKILKIIIFLVKRSLVYYEKILWKWWGKYLSLTTPKSLQALAGFSVKEKEVVFKSCKLFVQNGAKKMALFLVLICAACQSGTKKNDHTAQNVQPEQYVPPKNEVEVMVLQPQVFKKELLSNGKLEATQKSTLRFEVSGILSKIYVRNGQHVKKGQVLAEIDPFEYQQALENAQIDFDKAQLEFEDMLVGRGYDWEQRDSIPEQIYQMAAIRSGYARAKNNLQNAKADRKATQLRAPFSGIVANLNRNAYEPVSSGSSILTLIDDAAFEVVFYLIESEVNQIAVGDQVEVLSLDNAAHYGGKVVAINPIVEDNGMVSVKAEIKNDGKLIEGMNVKIRIQKDIPNKFVVPKSAVILRDNQEVLFKYTNGKAFWTYVHTTHENSTSYVVIPNPDKSSAVLTPGDTIIVMGNLNLAHNSQVEISAVL